MKVSIRKEIYISIGEMAHKLRKDGSLLEYLCEKIIDILHDEYNVDYETAEDTVNTLDDEELIEILEVFTKKLREDL